MAAVREKAALVTKGGKDIKADTTIMGTTTIRAAAARAIGEAAKANGMESTTLKGAGMLHRQLQLQAQRGRSAYRRHL